MHEQFNAISLEEKLQAGRRSDGNAQVGEGAPR
ncbi:hypothetical protein HD596_010026 [Nonomuraea jabiensis]|uniref:Uncharacterized protein n=1 Tax=Nonomuraea jabiensis TaxID=882448 RepID=A0A7W9GGB7_9ACTN|nr:hypothetical protein [Nonomuraea jabiensis]